MLTDDKFKSISGNLELELVELYKSQGETSEVEARLETILIITKELWFQQSLFSSGQIYKREMEFIKSKRIFYTSKQRVIKSIYSSLAKGKIDAILYMKKHRKKLNLN